MSSANYNGRQANNTSYIKNFVYGVPANLWKTTTYTKRERNTLKTSTYYRQEAAAMR